MPAALLAACAAMTCWQAHAVEFSPSARLDLDHASHQDDASQLEDGFLVRRAVLGFEIKFNDDWSFEAEHDFADDGEYKDVVLQYEGWEAGDIAVGQFKVPFGLQEVTSSRNIMAIERALPVDAFRLARRLGVGFDREGERYTFAFMGFGRTIDEDEGNGAAARYTFTPIVSDDTVLHLGAAIVTEKPLENESKFNADPEAKPADVDFVDTGKMRDVRRVDRLGLELAWQTGPFTAEAEWMQARVKRDLDPDASFDGWYVAGSWMLNGGSRRYKDGRFDDPLLSSPYGALELTARYSHLDLDDGLVRGGEEDNITLGLNWYLGSHGRIMLNYIKVRSERRGVTDNPDILLARLQLVL